MQRLLRPESSLQSCRTTSPRWPKANGTSPRASDRHHASRTTTRTSCWAPKTRSCSACFCFFCSFGSLESWQESALTRSQHRLRNGKRSESFWNFLSANRPVTLGFEARPRCSSLCLKFYFCLRPSLASVGWILDHTRLPHEILLTFQTYPLSGLIASLKTKSSNLYRDIKFVLSTPDTFLGCRTLT